MEVLDSTAFHCNRGRFRRLRWGLFCYSDTLNTHNILALTLQTRWVQIEVSGSVFFPCFSVFSPSTKGQSELPSLRKPDIYRSSLMLVHKQKCTVQQKTNIRLLERKSTEFRKHLSANFVQPLWCLAVCCAVLGLFLTQDGPFDSPNSDE